VVSELRNALGQNGNSTHRGVRYRGEFQEGTPGEIKEPVAQIRGCETTQKMPSKAQKRSNPPQTTPGEPQKISEYVYCTQKKGT